MMEEVAIEHLSPPAGSKPAGGFGSALSAQAMSAFGSRVSCLAEELLALVQLR